MFSFKVRGSLFFVPREVELLVDLVPAQQCHRSSSLKRQLFVKAIRPNELLAWETRCLECQCETRQGHRTGCNTSSELFILATFDHLALYISSLAPSGCTAVVNHWLDKVLFELTDPHYVLVSAYKPHRAASYYTVHLKERSLFDIDSLSTTIFKPVHFDTSIGIELSSF